MWKRMTGVYTGLSLSRLAVSVWTEAEEDGFKYVKQSKLMQPAIWADPAEKYQG